MLRLPRDLKLKGLYILHKMDILFIIDPIEKLHRETDTTLAIMEEVLQRKHAVWTTTVADIFVKDAKPFARISLWKKQKHATLALEKFPVIFMRKDPPFSIDYVMTTSILSLVNPKKSFIINNPAALRNFNEKLGIFQFAKFIPPTIVSKKYSDIITFLKKHEKIVLKPLEGYAGNEIIVLDHKDKNRNVLLEMLTHRETRFIMAQKYLEEVIHGDKRVLLLNGKILGAQNRVAGPFDHRSNISAGGTSHKTRLTQREKKICKVVGKALLSKGIYFAGLDLIGGCITEINVTSPTGLVKMNEHEGTKLEKKVVDWIEKMLNGKWNM